MPIVRIAYRLVREHWALFVIYVVVFSISGALMGASVGGSGGSYEPVRPTAAVIDRDGSTLSRAIAAELARTCELVEVEDSTFALQEAAANGFASYVLVIPEGYGRELAETARTGADALGLECIVSYMSAQGSLVNRRVCAYAQELYALTAAGFSEAEAVAMTDEASAENATVVPIKTDTTGIPTGYLVYCQFALYALFGGVCVIVGTGLNSLRQDDVRRRIGASPVAASSHSLQIVMAILLCGVAVWAINAGVGLALYHGELSQTAPTFIGLMLVILFALMLLGTAFGFLVWQLGVRHELIHAIGNISAMVLTFLGGTWISIDHFDPTVRAVAQFTPGYWAVDAMQALARATEIDAALVSEVAANTGVVLLFAAALAAAGLAVGAARRGVEARAA